MEPLCARCGRYAAPHDYLCDKHRAELDQPATTESETPDA